jgi:hypothetical protein
MLSSASVGAKTSSVPIQPLKNGTRDTETHVRVVTGGQTDRELHEDAAMHHRKVGMLRVAAISGFSYGLWSVLLQFCSA